MADNKEMNQIKEKKVELVQLDNGDIILRDAEAEEEPMIRFSFSDNIDKVMRGAKMDITRAMLEAGIQRHQELLSEQQSISNHPDSEYLH